MMSKKVSLQSFSSLSETLLLPLWAKAVEQAHPNPLLRDTWAPRILAEIDYDFSKFETAKMTQVGCCARAALIDGQVAEFIAQHPQGVVIQLGAGLDARFERLGNPGITAWYDLDLPEVIALRRLLLAESDAVCLAQSMFDEAWAEQVKAHRQPVCIILEGVLMYFQEEQVKQLFNMLRRNFVQAWVIFDTIPVFLLGKAKMHDSLRYIDNRPEFLWAVDQPEELKSWTSGADVRSVHRLSKTAGRRYPFLLRALYCTSWGRKNLDQRVITLHWNGDELRCKL